MDAEYRDSELQKARIEHATARRDYDSQPTFNARKREAADRLDFWGSKIAFLSAVHDDKTDRLIGFVEGDRTDAAAVLAEIRKNHSTDNLSLDQQAELCRSISFYLRSKVHPVMLAHLVIAEIWTNGADETPDTREHITLEICSNTEWLRDNCGVDLDGICGEWENEAADDFGRRLTFDLANLGYCVERAAGQRATCHGWNGANLFKHKLGPVGTFDDLTPEQLAEIEAAVSASATAAATCYSA